MEYIKNFHFWIHLSYIGGKTAEKRRQQKNIDKAEKKIIWKTKREKKNGMLKGEKKKIENIILNDEDEDDDSSQILGTKQKKWIIFINSNHH